MRVNVKTVTSALVCGLLLVSLGASAANKHQCKEGEKWDKHAKACVKK